MAASLNTASTGFSPVLQQMSYPTIHGGGMANQQRPSETWSTNGNEFYADNYMQDDPGPDFQLLNSFDAYRQEHQTISVTLFETLKAYDDRIQDLVELAYNDGYSLNFGSQETFLEFIKNNPFIRLDQLVLLENGNLRAVWKGDNNSHVGLQFIENGQIQYVLFKRRQPDRPVSRVYGRDTPDGIFKQILALGLKEVMYFD